MAERVILFVVDGLRPDGLLQARAPVMQGLMERGAYSLQAQSVMPSITLPCHMSMFHGVPPEVHGVTTNAWQPAPGGPLPGLFEVVRQARRHPAAFYTWDPLRDLSRPGALAYACLVDIYWPWTENSDLVIARRAAEYLLQARPDFTFVYLGLVDEIAHRHGWMSAEYLDAVAVADEAIGHVLEQVAGAGLLEGTACLLVSDHGGHEHRHGEDVPEDMTIPWALAGPGIRRGCRLEGPVRIIDTAPTIARLLDLPIPAAWQGRPILEAWEV
jgi:predicted AlkP superfamily pyrophosphatase or phosphodiesterase